MSSKQRAPTYNIMRSSIQQINLNMTHQAMYLLQKDRVGYHYHTQYIQNTSEIEQILMFIQNSIGNNNLKL